MFLESLLSEENIKVNVLAVKGFLFKLSQLNCMMCQLINNLCNIGTAFGKINSFDPMQCMKEDNQSNLALCFLYFLRYY